jgi:hypothetical protein
MGARKDKRRKLARKVILEHVRWIDPDSRLTEHLTDGEYEALCREINKAKVTVTWDGK